MLLNRKLIIAVLTLGLILSFSSAAIGYDDTNEKPGIPIRTNSLDAPLFNAEKPTIRHIPDFTKPSDELQLAVNTLDPSYVAPERVCENLNYAVNHWYFWSTPNSYDDTHWGMKFIPDNACTLRSVTVAVAQENGTPGMTVEVYSDVAGYPGALIATFDVPNSALPPLGFYTYLTIPIDASNAGGATFPDDFIFTAGEGFHVAASVTGGGTVGVETLKFYSDDGSDPTDLGTVFEAGVWYLMVDSWGFPGNFEIEADICYENEGFPDDCYNISKWCGMQWAYGLGPGANYQQDGYAVNFIPQGGVDSLTSIDIYLNDLIDDGGFSIWDDPYTGSGNFPLLDIILCPATVTGEPDVAAATHTFTIDMEPFAFDWPSIIEFAPINGGVKPVMTGRFFIVLQVNGGGTGLQQMQFISDGDDVCPTYTSWGLYNTGFGWPWRLLADIYGADNNLCFDINMCKDIYTTCAWDYATGGAAVYMGIPGFRDVGNTLYMTAIGVRFDAAAAGCDLGELDMWFYPGATYAEDAEIAFYDDSGPDGLPGERLLYIPFPNGSVSDYHDVAPNFFFETSFWLVVESFAENDDDLYYIADDGSIPTGRNAMKLNGDWAYYGEVFVTERNFYMGVYRCCYPFVVRTCAPDGDWPTLGKDPMRTQSTLNEYGDIQCNLTKSWTYINSVAAGINFAQPIIAEGYVYAYMFNCLVCVDINTGIEKWRRDANYLEIGGSCRATPTYHDGALYCGGGDNGYFSRFDIETGATVWSYIMASHAQYAPHVILDVEGTELVIVSDGYGNIYGLQTSDGANYYYPGETLPTAAFTTSGQVHKAMTTDGTYLYVGCDEYLTNPNVWRLAVSSGGITFDWSLVDGAVEFSGEGVGWQLQEVSAGWPQEENSYEGCYSSIIYSDDGVDGQWIYFVGSFTPQNASPVHNGGIIYKVSADGTTLGWASECNGSTNGTAGGILNDKAQVIYGGWSHWNEGGEYFGPMAFAKSTGFPQWGPNDYTPLWNIQTIPDEYGHVSQPGLLTCETIADPADYDWLVFGNEFGYWNFANPTIGEVVWHRRSTLNVTYLAGPVADEAGHILLADGRRIHCLANDVPRQRLHIADMHPEELVPFGLTDYEEVTFPDLLVNTGCATLEIFHVELLGEDNGTFPAVRTVNNNRDESISTLLAEKTGLTARLESAIDERSAYNGITRIKKAPAAFALPDYVLSLVGPEDGTTIDPGNSEDIVVAIDGTKIPRGASSFYAEIDSDDPDYFLDSAYIDLTRAGDYAKPTVFLTIVGGCLYQNTTMYFGEDEGNWLPVWNSTFIHDPSGTGDEGLSIDGETSWLFGCDGLFYSDQMHRIVMHATDGLSNPTWESILPDPLPTCEFGEAHDVVLAQITENGVDYGNVLGTMLNYAYVDSVEEHWLYEIDEDVSSSCPEPPCTLGVEWAWDVQYETGVNQPYSSELTEGFAFKALVSEYAVTDIVGSKYVFEDFWNFVISRHSVFSRYGTAIPGLFVGIVTDWDIDENTANEAMYDEEYSVGWMYETSSVPFPRYGGGVVKVPFGPGFTPLINTVDATTPWYGGEEPGFDSIYVWMSRPSTQFMLYDPGVVDDKRMWNTIAELNLPAWAFTGDEEDPVPDEAFQTYGYAFFAKYTDHSAAMLDNYSDMATLINKFCGFGRGDVNNDGEVNLTDIVYLSCFMHHTGPGPIPFMHMGDVDGDDDVDNADVTYMIAWYFDGGPAPVGDWALPQFVPAP